jgi:hypothetical protein
LFDEQEEPKAGLQQEFIKAGKRSVRTRKLDNEICIRDSDAEFRIGFDKVLAGSPCRYRAVLPRALPAEVP